MRVLFDIVHPADVLFFLHPIRTMTARGDDILILSRHKDITCELLDDFGLEHIPVSRAGNGKTGLGLELIARELAVLRFARRFRPDVMAGFGGVAISHTGKLLGVPSISYYDADTARLQTRITWPFITHLYVPEGYEGPVPRNRTTRFEGIKELSYFHPKSFAAEKEIALRNGLEPERDNYFVRLVGWSAAHDQGKAGWPESTLRGVLSFLACRGRVHISSERPLPGELEELRYDGSPKELHHVLAHCRMCVGESATMALESSILGVPAIYSGHDHPGTIKELSREGLVVSFRNAALPELLEAMEQLLSKPQHEAEERRDSYIAKKPELAEYVVETLVQHAAG